MDAELQEYQTQLEQVEAAIEADPGNEELNNLREELNNLIDLTKSIAGQAHASTSAPSSSSAPSSLSAAPIRESATTTTKPSRPTFAAGDDCLAKYAADNRWYPARVTSVVGSSADPVYSIVFKGYKTTEMVRSGEIKPVAGAAGNAESHSSPSSSAAPVATSAGASSAYKGNPKLTAEEEAERERKRKRSEKKAERHENKTQMAKDKANSWQKFAKKGQKKGYGIPGQSSMFKTPDDPLAKVGVVGAGRGMTSYSDRSKHVYEP